MRVAEFFSLPEGDDGTSFLTAKFFRDTGLLWKINHDILHPLGLALGVGMIDQEDDGASIAAVFRVFVSDDGCWVFTPEDNERKSADWEAFVQMLQDGLIDLAPGEV